jgi:hypothetical protein
MIAFLSINFNKPNYKNLTEQLFEDECANNSYFKLLLKLIFLCFYIKFGVERKNLSLIFSPLGTEEFGVGYNAESSECKKHIEMYGVCMLC